MPIYEYECQACEHICEMIQKIDDPAPEACPECGGGPVQKLISATNHRSGTKQSKDEAPAGRDLLAEHNDRMRKGNWVRDSHGHRVEVDANDPRLKARREKEKKSKVS